MIFEPNESSKRILCGKHLYRSCTVFFFLFYKASNLELQKPVFLLAHTHTHTHAAHARTHKTPQRNERNETNERHTQTAPVTAKDICARELCWLSRRHPQAQVLAVTSPPTQKETPRPRRGLGVGREDHSPKNNRHGNTTTQHRHKHSTNTHTHTHTHTHKHAHSRMNKRMVLENLMATREQDLPSTIACDNSISHKIGQSTLEAL